MSLDRKDAETTYRALGLGRAPLRLDHESGLREKAVALGGDTPDFPRMLIGQSRYEKVLGELVSRQLRDLANESSPFPPSFLTAYFRERFRSDAYDQLLREQDRRSDLKSAPLSADQRAYLYRRTLVQRVLSHIERRWVTSRAELDLLWQKTVGPRIASESQLVRIDRTAARAILRSLNSSLAFSLRRQPDLPHKLSEALGIPIREIRVIS
ncbi:hypothetical protein [Methylacidimicrobium tartarophylax]|uniref:Uncharacterized protein n=1 Tax=Methylacidimicrobium tartarophylax TaxID=1041768 RepID=A0A5E6MGQ1_9BACT|nr:hypothetical protein [Methylacidimicrobium tartarophylax]VVM07406.1 hypothetical protein MAMT_01744 [Methylacidimicrobium tartarophylax]